MNTWPNGRFLALSGARLPIVQAPMAGAGGVAMAVAAIRGGAVGSLPCALLTPEEVRAQVAEVRAAAEGPLNLNYFCHEMPEGADDSAWRALLRPFYEGVGVYPDSTGGAMRRPFDAAHCAAVEEVRPTLVSFHFGLPGEALLERVRRSGAKIVGNATTIAEARRWRHAASTRSLRRAGRLAAMPGASCTTRRTSRWGSSPCSRRSSTRSMYP